MEATLCSCGTLLLRALAEAATVWWGEDILSRRLLEVISNRQKGAFREKPSGVCQRATMNPRSAELDSKAKPDL